MNLSGRPIPQKPRRPKADPKRLDRVRAEDCIICQMFGEIQMSPTMAHHPIHGRFSQLKSPDAAAIPVCDGHHQANFDDSKIALHQSPDEWKDLYGRDVDYINIVRRNLGEEALDDEILGEWFS